MSEATMNSLFERFANVAPDRMAVVAGSETLPYRELNRRANQVAWRLRNLLVDRDDWSHLVQVFARSPYARRTVFFAPVQRVGARTFGSSSIRALYETVKREPKNTSATAAPTGAVTGVAG